jgi:hypothetical protein
VKRRIPALAATALLAATAAQAEGDDGEFKLTLGRYHMSDASGSLAGTDLNLRWRGEKRSFWVGLYQDDQVGRDWRGGWDANWSVSDDASVLPSLQFASGGFVGGSIAAQVGSPWYAQLGIGRTNLRPYVNLNFDPNDAITLALGWQGEGGRQAAVTLIADDRLGTGQKNLHFGGRWPVAGQRLTVDLLHKRGQGDSGWVDSWGWTVGWDWPKWFARVAHDPNQNYSSQDAWRLSAGLRF